MHALALSLPPPPRPPRDPNPTLTPKARDPDPTLTPKAHDPYPTLTCMSPNFCGACGLGCLQARLHAM